MKWSIVICICMGMVWRVSAQDSIVYTKALTQSLEEYGIRMNPVATHWLHPLPYLEDDFGKYDMVFVSEDDSIEMKFIFKNEAKANTILKFPQLEMSRLLTQFATNNQRAYINANEISRRELNQNYSADWGIEASFLPKPEITSKTKGKLISIFKEGHSLITVLIFYNNNFFPKDLKYPISYIHKSKR